MLKELRLTGVLAALLLAPALLGCGGGGGGGGSGHDPIDFSQGTFTGGDLPQPGTPPPGEEPPRKLSFRVLEASSNSGVPTAQQRVCRTYDEFIVLWNELQSWWQPGMGAPIPGPPPVDFATEIVVGIFLGPRPTAGYAVNVLEIEAVDDDAKVIWEEQQPGANCVTAQVITYPYILVAMERVEGFIDFEGSVTVVDCP